MEFGCEILILIGVPMTGFRGWTGVVAEDAAVEISTGFADWTEDVATVEVKTGLTVWIADCPDVVIVVRTDSAGRRDAVTTADEGTGFTVCREAVVDVVARTGFITGEAVTVTEADTGFIIGGEVVAAAEVATVIVGAGAAEVQVETGSWVGAGCIHCWIKL